MIYGDGDLGGIPWETIIKLYRQHIGPTERSNLDEYVSLFTSFIEDEISEHFRDEMDDFFSEYAEDYLHVLRDKVDSLVEDHISENGVINKRQVGNILRRVIREDEEKWKGKDKLKFCNRNITSKINRKHHITTCDLTAEILENHNVSGTYLHKITNIIISIFCSTCIEDSGIVFSGFGEKDIFPKLIICKIECIVFGSLKYTQTRMEISNTEEKGAAILPFAQTDTVDSFIRGISRQMLEETSAGIGYVMAEYDSEIDRLLQKYKIPKKDKESILNSLEKKKDELAREYKQHVISTQQKHHINPLVEAVEYLPKNEMAEVAESLVSITSFRQKISLDQETVGGAIDVAVVSKTDGFVWIKRKHYFGSELNPMFMSKYYKGLGS